MIRSQFKGWPYGHDHHCGLQHIGPPIDQIVEPCTSLITGLKPDRRKQHRLWLCSSVGIDRIRSNWHQHHQPDYSKENRGIEIMTSLPSVGFFHSMSPTKHP